MWREPCAPPEDGAVMRALYGGALRPLLPIISHKAVSDLGGRLLSARASEKLVPGFVKRNGIDMSQYPERAYASFNDFFTREMHPASPSPLTPPNFFQIIRNRLARKPAP